MVQTAVNSAVEALNLLVKCAKNYHMLPQSVGVVAIMGVARVWFIKNGCGFALYLKKFSRSWQLCDRKI